MSQPSNPSSNPPSATPIRSQFADDPEMADLVELFVTDLAERTETIAQAFEAEDWDTLKRTAHQLKGASGGYGFPTIGAKAGEVEQTIREGIGDTVSGLTADFEALRAQVDELLSQCNRAAA